jgi:TM2 domain-containing membrane protein YozV
MGKSTMSEKKILPAFLLCFFLGCFGAHRFYVGKIGTAILQIVTLGGLGIWALIDFIMIIIGSFTDKDGNKLTQWT